MCFFKCKNVTKLKRGYLNKLENLTFSSEAHVQLTLIMNYKIGILKNITLIFKKKTQSRYIIKNSIGYFFKKFKQGCKKKTKVEIFEKIKIQGYCSQMSLKPDKY